MTSENELHLIQILAIKLLFCTFHTILSFISVSTRSRMLLIDFYIFSTSYFLTLFIVRSLWLDFIRRQKPWIRFHRREHAVDESHKNLKFNFNYFHDFHEIKFIFDGNDFNEVIKSFLDTFIFSIISMQVSKWFIGKLITKWFKFIERRMH